MNKTVKSILISIASIVGIIFVVGGIKASQIFAMVESGKNAPEMTETVSTFTAETQKWPNTYKAVGTVEASEGITITAEVAGKVQKISFKPGEYVKKGTVLLVQESGNEQAQLSAAEARLRLAKSTYERLVQLRKNNTVSQSALDEGLQQMQSAQGEVDNLKTTLEKKIVKAPFDGRLGIIASHQYRESQFSCATILVGANESRPTCGSQCGRWL